MRISITSHQFLRRVAPPILATALFVVYLTTLAPGVTWANAGADSGDFIAAAATLGVAHPTGYPTYLLLARLFQLLPVGSLAVRTNLLSATSAALAAAVVALLVKKTYGGARRFAWAGGLVAGFAFGLSPLLWSQAVIAEVYALHALFVALILSCLPLGRVSVGKPRSLAACRRRPEGARPRFSTETSLESAAAQGQGLHYAVWRNRLIGLLFGLALGNHLTTVLLVPPWLALNGWDGKRLRLRPVLAGVGWMVVGALVYLYLPLRARAMPPVNWGNAVTWKGFWWVVSGSPYQGMLGGVSVEEAFVRVQAWAGLVTTQYGWPGMLAGLYGLFFGRAASPRVKLTTGWVAFTFSAFAIGYAPVDSYVYLIPAFLALAVWLGLGVATALEGLPARLTGMAPVLVCVFLLTLLANAGLTLPRVDASRDWRAETFGRTVMAQAPANAVIFTDGDRGVFALWYFHFALGQRPDVAVIVDVLRVFKWYQESLSATYPDLIIPDYWEWTIAWKQALIAVNNGRPACVADPDAEVALVCDW